MSFFKGTSAEPREYQERLCAKTLSMLDGTWSGRDGNVLPPAKSVLIEAPTGSGKTVVALAIGQALARRGLSVGFVAMRRNLLKQANEMRERFGFRIPDMVLTSMFSKAPSIVDVLIVDESQHDATASMAHIHATVRPKMVIGLSATPYRSDRAQLAFERTVRDVGIHTLIQEGWLSPYDHYTIPKYSPESIATLFHEDRDRWGKSVIFFLTKAECDRASRLLKDVAGVDNEVVWAESDREAQIEAFADGRVQVLVSMAILAEGFDMEDMKTVFVRPSSKLPAVQMGGRVLRRHPGIAAKQIVQCQDTRHPFVKTARPRQSFVQTEGEFRTLEKNERIDEIARQYAGKVVRTETSLPNFILKGRRRKFRNSAQ